MHTRMLHAEQESSQQPRRGSMAERRTGLACQACEQPDWEKEQAGVPACAVKAAGLQASRAGHAGRMRRRLPNVRHDASSAQHTSSTCTPARRLADCASRIPHDHCRCHGDCHGTAHTSC